MDPPRTPANGRTINLRPRTPSQINPFTHRAEDSRRVFNNAADATHSESISAMVDAAQLDAANAAELAAQEDVVYYDVPDEDDDQTKVPIHERPGLS